MKIRHTRWYNSLTLRLLVLFWILLFLTASSGFVIALWQTKAETPIPLAQEIRRTLEPLLSDPATFGSLEPGRLVAGDYRVVVRLAPEGQQQFLVDAGLASRHQATLLKQIDAGVPQQRTLENLLLVGPFELNGTRLLLTRPLSADELQQRQVSERETREARTIVLAVGSGFIALLLGYWLVQPIHRLTRATREIAAGSASPKLRNLPRRSDELGELARALKKTAHDLAVSRDAQRRLLSDVSHELRSPLARMQVALSLTEKEAADNPHWNQMERDLERLGSIIERILSLSRLENGLIKLNRERIITKELANRLIADLIYSDASLEKRLVLVDDSVWPDLHADMELLRLVLENVVRNALQYSSGKVEISCSKAPTGWCVMIVRDHGKGVTDAQMEKLFEPFYRGDPSRLPQAGVGLGMALSRRAAGVLGGKLSARNHPDGGLEVSIHLPCEADKDKNSSEG
ncbi:MAG: HAMP domain-containing sensor histidine kinase [Idiomarina sp.]